MIYIDKKGRPFEVKRCETGDDVYLTEMYDSFSPKGKFQGMPPLERGACQKWIEKLLETGANFLAWREGKVIGHVVIIPDIRARDGEYLIFISQDDRNRGVGSQLTQTVLDHAKTLGLKKIWLTVGAYNFIAIRLYQKFGFEFTENVCESERPMVLWL
jgi:ribosomal protein S18 acetylase RimI-like enzyme